MCRNMLIKSGLPTRVLDRQAAPVERLTALGAEPARDVADISRHCDVIFLSLPAGPDVEAVVLGADGLMAHGRAGQVIVDLSTIPVSTTRRIATTLADKQIRFADAPVARTRAAAEAGTLSITVGAPDDLFAEIAPLLAHMGSDVTHCGGVGCGQVVKLMNNMMLVEIGVAVAEALAVGAAAGVDRKLLLETLSKGSGDSFALRNHGLKAMLPDSYPRQAFSTVYALKDVMSALELAGETGFDLPGAKLAASRLEKARDAGFGDDYWPVIARVVDRTR
jgi:3-hydroxyisobutyrate dehydrogenase-like beta-hydroxyacid dehydrogenase